MPCPFVVCMGTRSYSYWLLLPLLLHSITWNRCFVKGLEGFSLEFGTKLSKNAREAEILCAERVGVLVVFGCYASRRARVYPWLACLRYGLIPSTRTRKHGSRRDELWISTRWPSESSMSSLWAINCCGECPGLSVTTKTALCVLAVKLRTYTEILCEAQMASMRFANISKRR